MKTGRGIVYALALSATAPVYGEATVYVEATTEDSVGRRFVYEVREQIQRSSLMNLASSESGAGYVVQIVTVEDDENMSTAYSWVLTTAAFGGGSLLLNHGAGVCGTTRIRECAGNVLAVVDEQRAASADFWARVAAKVVPKL